MDKIIKSKKLKNISVVKNIKNFSPNLNILALVFAGSFQYLNNTKKVFNFIKKIKPKFILIEGITLFSNFKKKNYLLNN